MCFQMSLRICFIRTRFLANLALWGSHFASTSEVYFFGHWTIRLKCAHYRDCETTRCRAVALWSRISLGTRVVSVRLCCPVEAETFPWTKPFSDFWEMVLNISGRRTNRNESKDREKVRNNQTGKKTEDGKKIKRYEVALNFTIIENPIKFNS